MAMTITPVRLPNGILEKVDDLVSQGLYSSKSDVIRDAIRRLVLSKQIGSIKNTGDSVKEIKKIRKQLSKKAKEKFDLHEINNP